MNRFRQILFVVSVLAISWNGMLAVHELGHVIGAGLTGGAIESVVLHPFTNSRTDVFPIHIPRLSLGWIHWLESHCS